MVHWYKLLKSAAPVNADRTDENSGLVAYGGRDPAFAEGNSAALFGLGLLESLPLVVGGFAAFSCEDVLFCIGGGAGGLVGMFVVCWLFRDKVPAVPIRASQRSSDES